MYNIGINITSLPLHYILQHQSQSISWDSLQGGQGMAQPAHLCRAFSQERCCDMRLQNEPQVPGERLELQLAMLHYHVYHYNEKVVISLNLHYTELYMHHANVALVLLYVDWTGCLQSLGIYFLFWFTFTSICTLNSSKNQFWITAT